MNDKEKIVIDPEFSTLIPPLTDEEFAGLEKSIVEEGCRDALVVWNEAYFPGEDYHDAEYNIDDDPDPYLKERLILIDGHNRYKICQKHGIKFQIIKKEFDSRDHAYVWICDNQMQRRNLSQLDRITLEDKKRGALSKIAKDSQGERNDIPKNSWESQSVEETYSKPKTKEEKKKKRKKNRENETDYKIAKAAGVSEDTVRKVRVINEKGTEELKQQVRNGDKSINGAFNEIVKKESKKAPTAEEHREQVQARHDALKEQKTVSISDIARDKQDVELLSSEIRGDFIKALKPINQLYVLLSSKELDISLLNESDKKTIILNIDQTASLLNEIATIIKGR